MFGSLILNAFMKYIEQHPEVLEQLVAGLVNAIMSELSKIKVGS